MSVRPNYRFDGFLDSVIANLNYELLVFLVVDGLSGDISRLDFIVSEPTNLLLNASGSSDGFPLTESGELFSFRPIFVNLLDTRR